MSAIFDDVSRIIASPVSRRKALALVGKATGGAVLAALGLGAASWASPSPAYDDKGHEHDDDKPKCGRNQTVCGKTCCNSGQTCCDGKCCSGPCCNGKCCEKNQVCCDGKCLGQGVSKNGKCRPDDD